MYNVQMVFMPSTQLELRNKLKEFPSLVIKLFILIF